MKKLFLFISIVTMAFGLMAKEVPNVIVHKSHGGLQAIINCYDDITYTPATSEGLPANLDCYGAGWSFCRVPSMSFAYFNPTSHSSYAVADKGLTNAINQIIEYSESNLSRGTTSGSKSITVAVPSGSRGSESYFVKGTWVYDQNGDGELKIFINPASNLVKVR